MQKILIIQTAFIGDVVLATALVEKLAACFPGDQIDFLLRKGNETLLLNNPNINIVLIWDKKDNKIINLLRMIGHIRKRKYDRVINLQRFFSTGFITILSGGKETIGFDKNPLSFLFSKKVKHRIGSKDSLVHEVERNNDLVRSFTDAVPAKPRMYPSAEDIHAVQPWLGKPFITMTPGSVWFTKKYPAEKWGELINQVPNNYPVYLLGGKENLEECNAIKELSSGKNIQVLAGQLSFLQSAALMKGAFMNYVNDSAPLHFASSVNAPVTAIFCSTVPAFGFTPLSDQSFIVETKEALSCRPCGLHGKKQCPENHFKCGWGISTEQLIKPLNLPG